MDWKKYRTHFSHNKISEDFFLLGIDLGSSSSAIAYFDPIRNNSEILDISGGYGKVSAPTMMQYIADSAEWIFGEYAILNANGADALLADFVARLGHGDYASVGDGLKSMPDIAAIYLKELISNCRSINPKAQIAGIIATVPDFIGTSAKAAISNAFRKAGYEKSLIALVDEREAYITHFLFNNSEYAGRLILLDFGARGLRGSVYDVAGSSAACVYSDLEANLSMARLDDDIYNLFTEYYCASKDVTKDKLSSIETANLLAFAHQHKDMALQVAKGKSLRMYYNFTYPPFSKNITFDDIDTVVRPMAAELADFVKRLISKAPKSDGKTKIICGGGGFEIPWAKACLKEFFGSDITFYKNSKAVLAEGAALLAAERMNVLPSRGLIITDSHKIPCDIGIKVMETGRRKFYPIIERGSWLWQKPVTAYVILQDDADEISIFSRVDENESEIGRISLSGLPKRPHGTTRLSVTVRPSSLENYDISVKDLGFGEMFAASDFERRQLINYKTR